MRSVLPLVIGSLLPPPALTPSILNPCARYLSKFKPPRVSQILASLDHQLKAVIRDAQLVSMLHDKSTFEQGKNSRCVSSDPASSVDPSVEARMSPLSSPHRKDPMPQIPFRSSAFTSAMIGVPRSGRVGVLGVSVSGEVEAWTD